MKEGPFKSSLEETSKAISEYLEQYQFSSPKQSYKGLTIIRWSRDAGWKRDAVEIRYRSYEITVLVNLVVLLPTENDEDDYCEFSGIGVPTPVVPQLFHNIRSKWYAKKVVKLLSKQMGWFEQYGSKEKCLRMSADEHRTGPLGGPAYTSALRRLEGCG